MTGPYRVEVDDQGCGECQHDRTWYVIGPDDVASSTSYGDEEDAHSLAAACDRAYELGKQSIGPAIWTKFAPESLPPPHSDFFVWDAEFNNVTTAYCLGDTLARAQQYKWTHWMPRNIMAPPPKDELPQQEPTPPVEAPEPPPLDLLTIQPAPAPEPIIKDWDDDIPFSVAGLLPLAGLMAYVAKALFQV